MFEYHNFCHFLYFEGIQLKNCQIKVHKVLDTELFEFRFRLFRKVVEFAKISGRTHLSVETGKKYVNLKKTSGKIIEF